MTVLPVASTPDHAQVDQRVIQLRPGLTAYSGSNFWVAELVASYNGEVFAAPYRTLALTDSAENAIAVVLHSAGWTAHKGDAATRVWLSVQNDGFRVVRDLLLLVALAVFEADGFDEIATRVRGDDVAARRAFYRLGFRLVGREHWHDGDRIVMALRPADFPRWFAAWRRRRAH